MKKLLFLATVAVGIAAFSGYCHLYFGTNLFGNPDLQGWWWFCW